MWVFTISRVLQFQDSASIDNKRFISLLYCFLGLPQIVFEFPCVQLASRNIEACIGDMPGTHTCNTVLYAPKKKTAISHSDWKTKDSAKSAKCIKFGLSS